MKEFLKIWIYSDGKKSAGKTGATIVLLAWLATLVCKFLGLPTIDNTTLGIVTGTLGFVFGAYAASKFS
jgi:energy-converting hydrogenase Eha subunit A